MPSESQDKRIYRTRYIPVFSFIRYTHRLLYGLVIKGFIENGSFISIIERLIKPFFVCLSLYYPLLLTTEQCTDTASANSELSSYISAPSAGVIQERFKFKIARQLANKMASFAPRVINRNSESAGTIIVVSDLSLVSYKWLLKKVQSLGLLIEMCSIDDDEEEEG